MRSIVMVVLGSIVLGAALLVSGCGDIDQSPAVTDGPDLGGAQFSGQQALADPAGRGDGAKGFYPLDIGNEWKYVGDLLVVLDGDTTFMTGTAETRTLVGTEERFGREYVLERQVQVDEDEDTLTVYWVRYRQDGAGLYEADIPVTEPPLTGGRRVTAVTPHRDVRTDHLAAVWRKASESIAARRRTAYDEGWQRITRRLGAIDAALGTGAFGRPASQGRPGGVLPDELTRLRYPLHPGQEWVVRDDPFLSGVVLNHDVLDLAPGRMAGWKVAFLSSFLGPEDRVAFWYGRDGFLGLAIHVEEELIDMYGNPLGTIVIEERQFLEDLDLGGGIMP